jgi:hypothetical protein
MWRLSRPARQALCRGESQPDTSYEYWHVWLGLMFRRIKRTLGSHSFLLAPTGLPALYFTWPICTQLRDVLQVLAAICAFQASFGYILALALILVLARGPWVSWEDHRPSVDLRKGLGGNRRALCADRATDGHEEALIFALALLPAHGHCESLPEGCS